MTSREIAELTGKRHDHVLRDVRRMLEDLEIDGLKSEPVTYRDEKNEEMPEYRLPKDLTICLVAGYDAKLRLAIIRRWEELERLAREVPTDFRGRRYHEEAPGLVAILDAIKALGGHLDARLCALEAVTQRAALPGRLAKRANVSGAALTLPLAEAFRIKSLKYRGYLSPRCFHCRK